jgi:hypothetical protein
MGEADFQGSADGKPLGRSILSRRCGNIHADASDFACCGDDRHYVLMMVEPMLEL